MAKRNTDKLFLAGSPNNNDSDGNSEYESNGITRSGYSDGGSIFGELSACRDHHYTIQQRSTARHDDNRDDSANLCDDAAGGPSAISTILTVQNISLCLPCKSGVL